MSYEFLEHTADVKFQAVGSTIEEAFISSASALFEVIRGDMKILEQEEKILKISGRDLSSLLHNFLEEFLFLLDSEDFLVSSVADLKIDKSNYSLVVRVVGDKARNYVFTNDVKAITYNEMLVEEIDGKFSCIVVLDV